MQTKKTALVEKERLVRKLLIGEIIDYEVLKHLAAQEKERNLKQLLEKLSGIEASHIRMWREISESGGRLSFTGRITVITKVYSYLLARRFLGVAFITMLLGKGEAEALERYSKMLYSYRLSPERKRLLDRILEDEENAEADLKAKINKYRGQLNHIRSIIFGLNDGLVEILAAVTGIAVVATSSSVVVLAGIIIGVSGTLSMAGGSYLSSKSHDLIEGDSDEPTNKTPGGTPLQEAAYTGVYYFFGSLVAVFPFMLGLKGFAGIALSILSVSIVLTVVSIVVAVTSGTSVRKRVIEMLLISLGAVACTIILGTIARTYFGVVI